MKTPYEMCINNVARFIRYDRENKVRIKREDPNAITAFTAAEILSLAFCKSKEEIAADIALVEDVR
jgi:hypothetical protein